MKTKMQSTSLEAYNDLQPLLPARQRQIFYAVKTLGVCCDRQIADFTGWEINRVTGRRNELAEAGLLEIDKRDKYNGRTVIFWRVKSGNNGN